MKKIILLMFAFAATVLSSARQMYVVSAGIADYAYIHDLRYTENDATLIADLFRTHTDNVTLVTGRNASRENLLSTLRIVFSKAEKDDVVIFAFSGHGGKGGLCAYDTKDNKTLLKYSDIQTVLRSCKSDSKILLIDACYSGGLRSSKEHSQSRMLTNQEGVMLFLSSRTNETSQESVFVKHGYFMHFVNQGLRGGADKDSDRVITAKELYNFVSDKVREATRDKQHPVMWGKFNNTMKILSWNAKK